MDEISLASEFAAPSEAEWLALVEKALGGKPFDALRSRLHEGFRTEPLYTRENAGQRPQAAIDHRRGWEVVLPIAGTLADERSRLAELRDDAIALRVDFDPGGAKDATLPLETLSDFESLFDAVPSSFKSFYLSGLNTLAASAIFTAYAEKKASSAEGSAGFDPFTEIAITGEIAANREAILADAVDAAFYLKSALPKVTPFLASDRAWHEAGGSAVQELAFTLAAAVSYWRALAQAGMPLDEGAARVGFRLTASADIFTIIAKFRAIRLLWRKALACAGVGQPASPRIVAEMSYPALTGYDSHNNLLRGTAAAFAAAIGGATAIFVHPFDAVNGESSLSRRLARNTSLLLKHEANLSAVADAAAGSSYVEALTHKLAERSWRLFREVKKEGGLASALESGFILNELNRVRAERERAVARRGNKITGISAYPDLGEVLAERASQPSPSEEGRVYKGCVPLSDAGILLPPSGKGAKFQSLVSAAKEGCRLPDLQAAALPLKEFTGIAFPPVKRWAEPFEELRRQSDLALSRLGSHPPIFLAPLGRPEDYRESAAWARSFFAIGGIEGIAPDGGFAKLGDLVDAFRQSPSPIACLCSSEAGYAAAKGAASALKAAGALFLYLAAPPAVLRVLDARDTAAIDRLVHEGCDAVAILRETHRILRVHELAEQSGDA